MSVKCDVLVVGGGPAGCSAARAAAKNGAKTILIEKQQQITNIPCAEGVGSYLFPLLPFRIPKSQLIWRINGIYFSDGDIEIVQNGNFYKGWSLDRKNFNNWLFSEATNSGAEVIMNSELIDINFSKEYNVSEVTVKSNKKISTIEPSFIVAADGIESSVAKILGLYKKSDEYIGHIYSWEMKNLSLNDPHLEQIYFGDFAPRAYGYIFPKSKNTANIGVGSTKGDNNLEKLFNSFVEEIISSQTKNAVKTIDRSGKAPVKYMIPKWNYGNVIFTGDAANQNLKPFVEGILPSIICGDIAGKVAGSKGKNDYKKSVNNKLLNQFKKSDEILEKIFIIDNLKGKNKDLLNMHLFAFTESDKIDELFNLDKETLKKEILRKSNSINGFVTMLRYFIWYFKVLATGSD